MDVQKNLVNTIIRFKHDLDRIPELGWNEKKTSEYIVSQLGDEYLWKEQTAIVYTLGDGPSVFFRAELDALATTEGIKHVCGHSAHLAALMGAYLYFRQYPPHAKVHFFFQPCEEGYPSGAKKIADTYPFFKDCKFGFAFHTYPSDEPGILMNPVMASGDYVEIDVRGQGTHIKNKYQFCRGDVAVAASELLLELNRSTFSDALINIGVFSAGESPNSIAGAAKLAGDVRALTIQGKAKVIAFLKEKMEQMREKYPRISFTEKYYDGYPLFKNNSHLLVRAQSIFSITKEIRTFATEDFSLYPIPTLFLLIGTGLNTELHEIDYVVPDTVLSLLFSHWITLGESLEKIMMIE